MNYYEVFLVLTLLTLLISKRHSIIFFLKDFFGVDKSSTLDNSALFPPRRPPPQCPPNSVTPPPPSQLKSNAQHYREMIELNIRLNESLQNSKLKDQNYNSKSPSNYSLVNSDKE